MEAKEEKRQEYLELIKDIPKDKLVFIDESGIEVSASKVRGWVKKGKILDGKKSGKYYERIKIFLITGRCYGRWDSNRCKNCWIPRISKINELLS